MPRKSACGPVPMEQSTLRRLTAFPAPSRPTARAASQRRGAALIQSRLTELSTGGAVEHARPAHNGGEQPTPSERRAIAHTPDPRLRVALPAGQHRVRVGLLTVPRLVGLPP